MINKAFSKYLGVNIRFRKTHLHEFEENDLKNMGRILKEP